jgi:hypothetical protein
MLLFFWLPNKYAFKTVTPTEDKKSLLLGSSEGKSYKNPSNGNSKGKKQIRKKSSKEVLKSITADPQQNQQEEQPQPQPTIEIDQL